MKELDEEEEEKNKLLEEQRKLLKQKNEQDKILKQQNDKRKKLLEEQKKNDRRRRSKKRILQNITFKNIDKVPIAELTPLRRDIKKPTPSPSKIPTPITKSREPQGVAVGEQAGIAIMENKLETSKDYIEYLKKELKNKDFSSKKSLEISNKIIKEEDEVRKL